MAIRAVIFDLGGVLVRTVDRSPREQLAASLGITYDQLSQAVFDSESARQATLGQCSDEVHWESVCRALNVSMKEIEPFKDLFWGGDTLDQQLINYLRSLRPKVKTALLSNAWPNLRKILTRSWGIINVFDEVVISAEEGLMKPDPRIYQIVLDRLQVSPNEAVFVDDVLENVDAARQAGLHAIQYQNTSQVLTELAELLDEH